MHGDTNYTSLQIIGFYIHTPNIAQNDCYLRQSILFKIQKSQDLAHEMSPTVVNEHNDSNPLLMFIDSAGNNLNMLYHNST